MTAGRARRMRRYAHLGRWYDLVSLEALLYRRPRRRLAELLGPLAGATVIDVGCGTGLNLGWLHAAVSPGGRVIGVDASESMLESARRRVDRHGWAGVELRLGEIEELGAVLDPAAPPDAFVATFVLSLLDDDAPFWAVVESAASSRPVEIAIADLGAATHRWRVVRWVLDSLAALGGGRPARRPWQRLLERYPEAVHESHLLGHVHLGRGSVGRTQSS